MQILYVSSLCCGCTRVCFPGARFTKYLTTHIQLSYDNAEVTIDWRRTSNLQNILSLSSAIVAPWMHLQRDTTDSWKRIEINTPIQFQRTITIVSINNNTWEYRNMKSISSLNWIYNINCTNMHHMQLKHTTSKTTQCYNNNNNNNNNTHISIPP